MRSSPCDRQLPYRGSYLRGGAGFRSGGGVLAAGLFGGGGGGLSGGGGGFMDRCSSTGMLVDVGKLRVGCIGRLADEPFIVVNVDVPGSEGRIRLTFRQAPSLLPHIVVS